MDVEALYENREIAADSNTMWLGMDGSFYHNGVRVKHIDYDKVDEELQHAGDLELVGATIRSRSREIRERTLYGL